MRNIRQLLVAFLMSVVVACGGGGTLESGGTPESPKYAATIKLLDATGSESSTVSNAKPLTIEVKLTSTNGGTIADRLIKFELTDPSVASFSNGTASAVTDSSGVAKIGLVVGTKSGAATINVTLPDNSKISRNFTSAGDGAPVNSDPVSSVVLQADKIQLGTGVTDKIELTAIVRDKSLNLLPNVTVKFAVEPGFDAELEIVSAVTDRMGVAKALLTTKSNPEVRDVVLSATAGAAAIKSALTIKVVGTNIEIAAPSAVVLGGTSEMSFTLLDSAGQPVRDKLLTITSALRNSFDVTNPKTDISTGRATVKYTAANSGTDTVTISALGVSRSIIVQVNADAFAYVKPAGEAAIPEVSLGSVASAKVRWTRSNSPMAAQQVGFATTRGAIAVTSDTLADKVVATASTDTAGEAEIFMRSTFAGIASLSATTQSAGATLQAQKLIEFVATVPDPSRPLEVQVIPAQLAPGDKAVVQAIVRDANNNPVKNKDVAFSLIDSFGGQLNPAIARTNSQGIATSEFIADTTTPGGGTPGEPKGLKVKATLADNSAISGSASVVVGNRTLFFRMGTGDSITVSADGTLYHMDYSVLVTDSSGNPVANQPLTVAVLPKRYSKGHWFKSPVGGSFKNWVSVESTRSTDLSCLSEDKNRNGVLDNGEDANGDKQLTPGNVVSVQKNIVADSQGIAKFRLTYAKEYAHWVVVDLIVSGSAAGTENVTAREVGLSVLVDDITVESKRPFASPFGVDAIETESGFSTIARCDVDGIIMP